MALHQAVHGGIDRNSSAESAYPLQVGREHRQRICPSTAQPLDRDNVGYPFPCSHPDKRPTHGLRDQRCRPRKTIVIRTESSGRVSRGCFDSSEQRVEPATVQENRSSKTAQLRVTPLVA